MKVKLDEANEGKAQKPSRTRMNGERTPSSHNRLWGESVRTWIF
jgi:hypothetical protein